MEQVRQWKLSTMMVIAMITWGLSWTNAKILGTYADPPLIMFWRFVIASICFFFIVVARESLKISTKVIPIIFINSIFMVLYNFFYFKGTQIGFAGTGGVLVTTLNPILTSIFSSLFNYDTLPRKDWVGLFIGLLAGGIILRIWDLNFLIFYNSGNFFFIMASLSWVAVTITTSKSKGKISFSSYSFWTFLTSALISVAFIPKNSLVSIITFDLLFWINLIILSVFAMAFGTSIYFYASTKLGPKKASSYIFLVPFTAILFSMYFLDEPFQLSNILGGGMGALSVYLINNK